MDKQDRIKVVLGAVSAILLLVLVFVVYCCRRRPSRAEDLEIRSCGYGEELEPEDLIVFPGGEHLTIHEILEAPGEVVGKSSYGTLYMASLQRSGFVVLLRFLRPACAEPTKEIVSEIQMLGFVRHPNLVPLQAFYSGTREEKLLVYPFFVGGTLSQFLRGK